MYQRTLKLSQAQRRTLVEYRNHDRRPDVRERCVPGRCATSTSSRSTRNSSHERSGAFRMRLLLRSRNWSRSRNSGQRPSLGNTLNRGSRNRSSWRGGRAGHRSLQGEALRND